MSNYEVFVDFICYCDKFFVLVVNQKCKKRFNSKAIIKNNNNTII